MRGCSSFPPTNDGSDASHDTEPGPCGANQQRVAPGPAQHLDELEAIDRLVRVRPRPPPRRGARGSPRRRTAPGRSVRAAAIRSASSWLPISPNATNGSRGRWNAVSGRAVGSGRSPASVNAIDAGRCAWATAPMSGRAAWIGQVDREIRGRAQTGRARAPRAPDGRATRPRDPPARARPCDDRSGVTSSRSASSRTDRLPSPAAISPRAPSRRPARISASEPRARSIAAS